MSESKTSKRPKFSRKSAKKARRVFKYFRPHRVTFGIGFLFLIASSITSMLFPELMGNLINAGSLPKDSSDPIFELKSINAIISVMVIVFAIQAFFSFFRIYLFSIVTQSVLMKIRQVTFDNLIRQPMSFFSSRQVGELNSRISTDITLLQNTFTTTIAEIIRQIIVIIIGITVISMISWKLTVIILAALPPIIIFAALFGRFIKKLSNLAQDKIADSNVIVQESYMGISSVKSFSNELFEINKYARAVQAIKDIAMKREIWRAVFVSFIVLFMTGAIAFVVWYGATLQSDGEITQTELTRFILYTVFVGASFGSLPDLWSRLVKAIGATENLMDLIDEEAEDLLPIKNKLGFKGHVKFQNVSFTYPSRLDYQVLHDISFEVEPGQQIAIVGGSGAGKSTMASLLLRFYDNSSGQILVDDQNVNSYSLAEYRNELAIVPQEVLLFAGTIYENIAYGKPNATEAEIKSAAKKANAESFILDFPDQYNTLVGDRGIQLSGGQRQRVAIARAILNDPSILILDEATSSLDSESEMEVQKALDVLMENRTSFVIAHRLSTIRNADKILVLHKGRLVESGNHENLFANQDGIYRKLCDLQFFNESI